MHPMSVARHPPDAASQRGVALFLLTVLALCIGLLFIAVPSGSTTASLGREQATAAALAQAKEALLGYAAKYRDDHPKDVFGYLPLPDLGTSRNNNIVPGEGLAAANPAGNHAERIWIGRLPWRSLGTPPLRDGHGECLWYATGRWQNSQKTPSLNWDTLGQFDVVTSDGTAAGTRGILGDAQYHGRPAAVIFAPGPILGAQNRGASAADSVRECGGNYDARNYLDPDAAIAAINNIRNYFPGSTNNASGDAPSAEAPKQILMPRATDASGTVPTNDRLVWITPDELFVRVKRRADFVLRLNALLADVAACLINGGLPDPVSGRVPGAVLNALENGGCTSSAKGYPANWNEMLWYAKPAAGTITLNGSSCQAILAFAGERTPGQSRASPAQKGNPANYLEATLPAFAGSPSTIAADPAIAIADPKVPATADAAVCLNALAGA